jgi:hypothetical protein
MQDDANAPDLVREAEVIAEGLKGAGIVARLLGATAIRMHAHQYVELHKALGRELSDLDFASYGQQREEIERYFTKELNYQMLNAAITPGLLVDRCIFFDETGAKPRVDVFLDKLQMNHVIDFRNRLETYYPTVPVTELVLEKLQIVKINEKDIKDLIVLLLAHEIGESGSDTVDAKYIAKLLSKDWGFYYTVSSNLKKLEPMTNKYEVLKEELRREVLSKARKLHEYVESEPKGARWKMRAKVGSSVSWYNEVEEVERAEWTKGLVLNASKGEKERT